MTEPTPPTAREQNARDLDKMARDARNLLETTSWPQRTPTRTGPHVIDPHPPTNVAPHPPTSIVRGGSPFDHLEDLGRMSAEAVMKQCEATIKSVEEMGHTVHTLVKRLGEALIECDADLKHVTEAANAIREKAKHTEAVIDHVNDLSKSIRIACADFQKKVAL